MSITHHLDDATLMSFAAGALPDALSAVAAAHVAMCARCRREVADLERVGGALLAGLSPATLDRGEAAAPPAAPEPAGRRSEMAATGGEVPGPVVRLIADGLDALTWRWLAPGVWDHALPVRGAGRLRLLKVAPRRNIPEHGHGGAELTLVLRGAFRDETGRYIRGDVADLDETLAHQPVTDGEEDCICMVASEAPEQFSGRIARHWQRLRGT
jgi:putative transcriptional regulator